MSSVHVRYKGQTISLWSRAQSVYSLRGKGTFSNVLLVLLEKRWINLSVSRIFFLSNATFSNFHQVKRAEVFSDVIFSLGLSLGLNIKIHQTIPWKHPLLLGGLMKLCNRDLQIVQFENKLPRGVLAGYTKTIPGMKPCTVSPVLWTVSRHAATQHTPSAPICRVIRIVGHCIECHQGLHIRKQARWVHVSLKTGLSGILSGYRLLCFIHLCPWLQFASL